MRRRILEQTKNVDLLKTEYARRIKCNWYVTQSLVSAAKQVTTMSYMMGRASNIHQYEIK